MSKQVADTKSGNVSSEELQVWLSKQSLLLAGLEHKGHIMKINFAKNAREKGKILIEVRERLRSETTPIFKEWVKPNTGIAYSTALLWIDLAENFDLIEQKFVDSNPLELTIRGIRDAIKDSRHAKGEGKPGSGRRKATDQDTSTTEDEEEVEATSDDQENVALTTKVDTPNKNHWEQKVSKAESEAEQKVVTGKVEQKTPDYSVRVDVFTESDQTLVYEALSNWSPISKSMAGSKKCLTVTARSQPQQISSLLQKLGEALDECQPQKLKVSIER